MDDNRISTVTTVTNETLDAYYSLTEDPEAWPVLHDLCLMNNWADNYLYEIPIWLYKNYPNFSIGNIGKSGLSTLINNYVWEVGACNWSRSRLDATSRIGIRDIYIYNYKSKGG